MSQTQRTNASRKSTALVAFPAEKSIKMETAAERLQALLSKSMRDCVSDTQNVAVAFSGGLDSGVLAFLAKKCSVKTQLITVGLENTTEIAVAEEAARALDLPIYVAMHSTDDVEATLPTVISQIGNYNPVNVGVAIPFFWTAQAAATKGLHVLLAGQGADELFGGYHRYLGIYAEEGDDPLRHAMFRDFVAYCERGFIRDDSVCAFHGMQLRLPYVALRVANFALSLPVSLKIESPTDPLRKRVLRKTAENLGVPGSIACRAKKAVQYATGVDKAMRKLAKRENLNTSAYCKKLFKEISST